MIGISNEPLSAIHDFIEDQGITFPVLRDNKSIYGDYNLPGAASPYPRDFILDEDGIVRLAKHEYEPGAMIAVIESLLGNPTSIIETRVPLNPPSPVLISSYPNPFNPDARIDIELEASARVSLSLLDVRGRMIQILIQDEFLTSGKHEISLNGKTLDSGIYFLRAVSGSDVFIRKIVKLN